MPFHGKLLAVSENGIFIYNKDDALSFVSKTSYAKFQNHIKDRLVFIPFVEIKSIKMGKPLAGKIDDAKVPSFVTSVIPSTAITFWLYAFFLSKNNTSGSQNIFNPEVFFGIILILCLAIAYVVLTIVAIFLALYQLIFTHLKGNYWRIKNSKIRGKKFQEQVIKHHKRFRIFKSDVLK